VNVARRWNLTRARFQKFAITQRKRRADEDNQGLTQPTLESRSRQIGKRSEAFGECAGL